eukprot:CAMPEP_0202492046 /NCGR_PEP_ID=MMETSP1361-20130828/8901_1 /ASSEMBLY_ACC=CAM_ASM_000849 /TAXON_ID=210615 /ORGANISM="Staurosira complex sp., Strain CCMP2646" /LENGTH=206 /DNA_ID=CAMNT_0049122197 /DNA_START=43 /DNA_END=663 /DNA_ORIENTATION=-
MAFRTLALSALVASAAAFAPASVPVQRTDVSLNAEMSKSIPFLVKPEKLDGSMVGDMGFDPMGLSEIQVDLKYARASELKHGRICMLALAGMIWQEYLPHWPGAAYETRNIFEAPASVGWAANIQIFLFMSMLELVNFNKVYGEGEPGDLGLDGGMMSKMTAEQAKTRMTSEIVHCRLAMIAFTGAFVQSLLYPDMKLLSMLGGPP